MSFLKRIISAIKLVFSKPSSPKTDSPVSYPVPPINEPASSNPNERGSLAWYGANYDKAEINPKYLSSAKKAAQTVLAGKERYKVIADHFGLPWWVIGCIHWREASCSFKGVLHNGEKIIGTGRKTSLVPRGRGPFETWEEAAIDAIKFDSIDTKCKRYGLSLEGILKAQEAYNGMGYFNYHPDQLSCYLYSYTNIVKPYGRYTHDGKYDYNADANDYSGIVPIIKLLAEQGEIELVRFKA